VGGRGVEVERGMEIGREVEEEVAEGGGGMGEGGGGVGDGGEAGGE